MTKYDNEKLKAIIKVFKENKLKVKVGVFGDKTSRQDRLNNPTIGLFHEFGTEKMPKRSFLRMPLNLKLDEYINKTKGLFNKKTINIIYEDRNLEFFLRKIGNIAERVVLDAFDTGGFGNWAPLAEYTKKRKKNNQILVETQQLRNSITNEVTK